MCVICASLAGERQPDDSDLAAMFAANPHGAGYMTARNGRVEISKGFMTLRDLLHAVHYEHFTPANPVVYHFRIATQGAIGPEMCHPFPLTNHIEDCKLLDVAAPIGVAHNGIISLTSDPWDKEYSDTAHFVADYLADLVNAADGLADPDLHAAVARLAPGSKFALMDGSGQIALFGQWFCRGALYYSNLSHRRDPIRYHHSRQLTWF